MHIAHRWWPSQAELVAFHPFFPLSEWRCARRVLNKTDPADTVSRVTVIVTVA